jgi:putative flippase GtrA
VRVASRIGIFSLVGVIGYVLQTGVLWLLVGRLRMAVVPATLAATEAAVLHNFVWHIGWTWADRPAGPRASLVRLLRFNVANGGVSLLGGAALMALLVHGLGVHYLVANLVTVLACSVVNFAASDLWVFRAWSQGAGRGSSALAKAASGSGGSDGAGGGAGSSHATYRATAT